MSADHRAALERVSRVRGVRGAVVASAADGLVVAESLMEEVDGRALAALAAALFARLRRTTDAAGLRPPAFLHLRGETGSLVVVPAAGDLLVVAVADPDADLGAARLEMRDIAARVA